MAALFLGGLAAAAAPMAHAAVQVYVGSNGTGTVNKYVNGVLVGQIAAQGSTKNDFARGVELGPDGMLYVDRLSGNTVQAYDPNTLTPVGSAYAINSNGGTSSGTYSMSFGSATGMYVSVMGDDSIQRIDTTTGTATNLVSSKSGGLQVPMDTLVVGNTLYVSAYQRGGGTNGSVLQYNATTGQFQGELIPAGQNGLLGPVGLARAHDGNLLVSGFDSNNILKFSPTGQYLSTFVGSGSGGMAHPADMTYNADDGNLYVASSADDSVRIFDGNTGAYLGFAVQPGTGGLLGATYLAVEGSSANNSVPEPTGALAGFAALAVLGLRRRRAQAAKA